MKDEGEESGYQKRWFDRRRKGKFNEVVREQKEDTNKRIKRLQTKKMVGD